MRLLATIFSFLAVLSVHAVQQYGWLCRVTLREYKVVPKLDANGNLYHYGAYTDNRYFWLRYYASSSIYPPYLSELGLIQYRQIDGSDVPKDANGNPSVDGSFYLVIGMTSCKVLDNGADLSPLGDLHSNHSLGPIYNYGSGTPYNVNADDNSYAGVNDSFDAGSISPLQGESGDKWLTYSDTGTPQLSDSATDGNHWVSNNGIWEMESNNPSTGGSTNSVVNLQPVITSIEGVQSKQDELRLQLVSWLGSNGASWVYDCKLSLEELKGLAHSLGYSVDNVGGKVDDVKQSLISVNLNLDDIRSTVSAVHSAVQSVDGSVGVVANRVSDVVGGVNAMISYMYDANNYLGSFNYQLTEILNKLNDIHDAQLQENTAEIGSLPLPDLSNQDSDSNLPWRWDTWQSVAQQTFNAIQGWGNNPAQELRFHDYFSDLFTYMVGTIPSVGTQSHMFDIEFDLPVIGHVSKSFDFTQYPCIPLFRTLCLWICYLFFALVSYKLIHGSII